VNAATEGGDGVDLLERGVAAARAVTSAVEFSGLQGDNSSPRRCPHLSPVPLFMGCDKLTLTLTATGGRAR
jgi:hypothetical protein